jgi:hypothetical protein
VFFLRQVLLARASRICFSLPWFNSFLCLRPNAAAWFSDFDSVLAWVSLLLLKGLGFSGGLLDSSPRSRFRCCFAFAEKFATIR